MNEGLQIHNVSFDADGITIQYVEVPTDVRKNLFMQHSVSLDAAHPDYREDIEALQRRLRKVLANALEDFASSEPYLPERDEDDDDMLGMGDS